MKIRIKKRGIFGVKKIGLDCKIGKIERMEDPLAGKGKRLSVFFKGLEGMGTISFSDKEAEMLRKKLKDKKESGKKKRKG